MAQVDQDFEGVFKRIVQWMIDNPDACAELEEQLETINTDFGDILIIPNRFLAEDVITITHNDKPIAMCKIDAPR